MVSPVFWNSTYTNYPQKNSCRGGKIWRDFNKSHTVMKKHQQEFRSSLKNNNEWLCKQVFTKQIVEIRVDAMNSKLVWFAPKTKKYWAPLWWNKTEKAQKNPVKPNVWFERLRRRLTLIRNQDIVRLHNKNTRARGYWVSCRMLHWFNRHLTCTQMLSALTTKNHRSVSSTARHSDDFNFSALPWFQVA